MPMYERDFGYLDALLDRNQQTGPAENTELDCDKSEWIFTGTVEPAVPGPGNIPGTYYVRVVKDNGASGGWISSQSKSKTVAPPLPGSSLAGEKGRYLRPSGQ